MMRRAPSAPVLRALAGPALILAAAAGVTVPGCASASRASAGAPTASAPAPSPTTAVKADPDRLREDMRLLVGRARDRVFPALVNISVVTVNYWGGKETKGGQTGSGTIISPDGYILTNQHVVDKGKKFRVTLADRREVPATLVGEDPLTDLAVIKIDGGAAGLAAASFGRSAALETGDYVMAMGSPYSLSRSVTLGIVSNAERVFTSGAGGDEVEEMEFDAGRTGLFTTWIQHDALINPGNSGGPLVNLRGEVVGVNAMGGNSLGFAIPSDLARDVAERLIKDGEVVRSSIGLALKPIKRSQFTEGVVVNSVVKDSPADRAGLKAGDLVTSIDGAPVTIRFAEEVPPLVRAIADRPVGTSIALGYRRGTTPGEAVVVTEKLLKEIGTQSSLRQWGFSAQEITERMARDLRLTDRSGVFVSGLREGSPAQTAEPALQYGDIVRSIDGRPVPGLEALVATYTEIMAKDPIPEFVMLGFDRGEKNQITLIEPRPDKKEDPPREVPKGWVGVATQPVLRDLAARLGHPDTLGFRVSRLYPDTLAVGSDLLVGDVVYAVNGEKIAPRGMQDSGMLQRKFRTLPTTGDTVLSVIRDGEKRDVKVRLERTRIGPDEAIKDENKDFELNVRELTFFDRDDYRWDATVQGVLVTNVEGAGWAGLAGVGERDLIQRINDYDVADIASYRKAMEALAKSQPERVTFGVLRFNRTYIMFAEPEWKPEAPVEKEGAAAPVPVANGR